jgi:hypothetical protein
MKSSFNRARVARLNEDFIYALEARASFQALQANGLKFCI